MLIIVIKITLPRTMMTIAAIIMTDDKGDEN